MLCAGLRSWLGARAFALVICRPYDFHQKNGRSPCLYSCDTHTQWPNALAASAALLGQALICNIQPASVLPTFCSPHDFHPTNTLILLSCYNFEYPFKHLYPTVADAKGSVNQASWWLQQCGTLTVLNAGYQVRFGVAATRVKFLLVLLLSGPCIQACAPSGSSFRAAACARLLCIRTFSTNASIFIAV